MTRQRPWILALLVVSAPVTASWGWARAEDGGGAAGGVRPLGVVDAAGDTQAGFLTIRGHHLVPVEGELQVKLGGQVLEVVRTTAEEILAVLPSGLSPGTYLLEVFSEPDSWAAPVTLGEVIDGAKADPVQVSLLRVREAHADLVAGTLLIRGESLGTSPDTTPTVTLADVPLVVMSANEVEVLAQLPGALAGGAYRVRVLRTAPGGTASIWTDAMDVTTVAGAGRGDITAVSTPAGGGLQGGVTSGDASLGLASCGLGQVLKSDGSSWSCAADTDTGVNTVVDGGGVTGSIASRTLTLGSTATPANAAGAIVARDGTGSFLAGSIGLAGNLDLPNTTSASVGVLNKGGTSFLHNLGTNNTFVGSAAGNLALTGTDNSAFGTYALHANTTGNHNSAFGVGALWTNTAGLYNSAFGSYALGVNIANHNSAFGYRALDANTTSSYNSAFGSRALMSNTTGLMNSAFGYAALTANTEGNYNSAFGYATLTTNTTGGANSAFGYQALRLNTTGLANSAFGDQALEANTEGHNNSAFGRRALNANSTGLENSAFGAYALSANTSASYNAAFGYYALNANTTGYGNSAFGHGALANNTSGYASVAIGYQALISNTTGTGNSAFGYHALTAVTAGGSNIAVGPHALSSLTSGWGNIAVGSRAGEDLTSGDDNIYIASWGPATESRTIRIGSNYYQDATYIAGIYEQTIASGEPVHVNYLGQLGLLSSSRRYKEQIADMDADSDVLLKLRPVSFYYRPELDETHLRQYGLVAEEVAEVAPELVAYDRDGVPQTVRYHFVNAMLLNEVQKQRRRIEEQGDQLKAQQQRLWAQDAVIQELKDHIARLEARLE